MLTKMAIGLTNTGGDDVSTSFDLRRDEDSLPFEVAEPSRNPFSEYTLHLTSHWEKNKMRRNIKLFSILVGTIPSAFAAVGKDKVAGHPASKILDCGIRAVCGC